MRWRIRFWVTPKEYTETEFTTLLQVRSLYTQHVLNGKQDFAKTPRWFQFEPNNDKEPFVDSKFPLCNTNTRDYEVSRLAAQFGTGEIAMDLQSAASEVINFQRNRYQKTFASGYTNDPINMVCCAIIDFLKDMSLLSNYSPKDLEQLKNWSVFIESLNENDQIFIGQDNDNEFRQVLAEVHLRLTHSDAEKNNRCIEGKIQAEIDSRTTRDLLNDLIKNIETIKNESVVFFMTLLAKEEIPQNFNYTTLQKIKSCEYNHEKIRTLVNSTNVGSWVSLLHDSLNPNTPKIVNQNQIESKKSSALINPIKQSHVPFNYQFYLTTDQIWRCPPCHPDIKNLIMEQLTITDTEIFNQYFKCMGLLERLGIIYKEGLSAYKLSGSGGDILLNLCTGGAINQYNADVQSLLDEIKTAFFDLIRLVRNAKRHLLNTRQAKLIPKSWEKNLERAVDSYNKIDNSINAAQMCNQRLIDNTELWQKNPQLLLNNIMQEITDFSTGIQQMHNDLLDINLGKEIAAPEYSTSLSIGFNTHCNQTTGHSSLSNSLSPQLVMPLTPPAQAQAMIPMPMSNSLGTSSRYGL